jgi:hypothetical protein
MFANEGQGDTLEDLLVKVAKYSNDKSKEPLTISSVIERLNPPGSALPESCNALTESCTFCPAIVSSEELVLIVTHSTSSKSKGF